MILRRFSLILVTQIVYIVIVSDAQNARSYDTNDWIPIQPSNSDNIDVEKKATGRVLNLDAPAQKFFPDLDYTRKKRPPIQQYLRETVVPKARPNGRPTNKFHHQPYKFENVPQFNQQPFYNSKEVNLPQYEQPPPLRQPQYAPVPPQIQQPKFPPPPPLRQQYFPTQQAYEQFNQNLNPTSINQELLGAVKNAPLLESQPQVHLPPKQVEQNESVQLLYVPLENLKANQPVSQNSESVYRQAPPPQQAVNFAPQENKQRLANIEDDFIQQALHAHKLQQQIQLGEPIQYQQTFTSTTAKPTKKRKPHQPPLAVYMGGNRHSEVTDVLNVLKDAKSIAVQDSITSNSPKIFIGPSTLDPPEGYSKFPLPYLNNISGSRIERKIDQLPFFVAPLSYKAPPGFSKIPLPSPHVGSVIVSHKDEEVLNNINQYQFTDKPAANQQISEYNFGEQPAYIQQNENNFAPPKSQYQQEVKEYDQLSHTLPLQYNQQLNTQEEIRQIPQQLTQQQFEEQLAYALQKEPLQSSYNEETKQNVFNPPQKTTQYEDFQHFTQTVKEQTTVPPSREIEFGQHYDTPKNLYSTQPEPPKTTYTVKDEKKIVEVTPKPKEQSSDQGKQNEEYINPLELAINQYELQQINTQFDSNREAQYEQQQPYYTSPRLPLNSSPATIVKDTYEQVTTREPERVRPQRRRKPTRVTTTTTTTTQRPTENSFDDGKYTVLEEFSAKSNPSTTQKYFNENNSDQYNVYKEQSSTTANYNENVEIQPAKVYKLTTPKPTENAPINHDEQSQVYRLPENQPTYIPENQVQAIHQHVLDQQLMDQQILNNLFKNNQEQVQTEATPTVYNPQNSGTHYQQNTDQIEPLVHNRGQVQYNQDSQSPFQSVYSNYPSQEQENSPKEVVPLLQEQAVRPLLTPTPLVPTTEEQQKHSTVRYETPSTENNIEVAKLYSTEPVKVETTTARGRTRSRGRGTSSRYTASTTASPTRRNVSRGRRPVPTRSTTERAKVNEDYGYDSSERTTRRTVNTNSKQRFRTRGRPVANSITERISQSTTENEIKAYNSPTPENVYHGSRTRPDPNSYMQFEHVVDQVVTIKPEENRESGETLKDYHQLYSIQQDSRGESPVVDVQITHPVSEPTKAIVIQQNEPTTRFIKQNVQVAGVLNNRNINEDTTTARTTTKSRGRTRGRSRFATTTTSRPAQRVTTTTESATEKQNSNEFYGFIRNPGFQEQKTNTQPPTQLYSSTYQSSQKPLIVVGGDDSDTNEDKSPAVQFVGEIRPKFQARNEETTQKPKTVSRTRGRVPSRRTQEQKQVYNEVSGPGNSEQATRRSSVVRSRGRSHFKSPENLKKKEEEIDENLNYPASFFKNRATTTAKTFQITIAPNVGENDEDQAPHPSIYSPRYVPKPDEEWTEISNQPLPNQIPIEIKGNNEEPLTLPIENEEPVALPIVNTELPVTESDLVVEEETQVITDAPETTTAVVTTEMVTKKKGRRRGVWKLIRHRPVDHFETAESQNYQSVINTYETIEKRPANNQKEETNEEIVTTEAVAISSTVKPPTSSEESSLFDTLYEMFGMKNNEKVLESDGSQLTTTVAAPTLFPEEITENPTTTPETVENSSATQTSSEQTTDNTTHPIVNETTTTTTTTLSPTTIQQETTKSAYDVEPWEMRAVKTSTSAEVSHETEICYKGRCVKSRNRKLNRNY